MKKILFILSLLISAWPLLYGQEQVNQSTLSSDTITFFDDALVWVDTVDCQVDSTIAELPDSNGKK